MNFGFLAGPLVGAVIGYFTNYLAVKMLFHPRQEIKVLGHALPFTPGVIPKGKPRLAKAIGEVVGNTLLTKEDIASKLLSEDMKEILSKQIMDFLSQDIKTELNGVINTNDNTYEKQKVKMVFLISNQIVTALSELQIGAIIAEEGGKAIKEKVKGSLLAMMVSDDLINSITAPECMDIEQTAVRNTILSIYEKIIADNVEKLLNHFNISKIIEDKINEMAVKDLEDLVLSVMKKELDTIVNLGAIIGFLIGIVNIFI